MAGCLRFLVGCALVLAVLVGVAIWGGTALLGSLVPALGGFIQRAAPTVGGYLELSRKVEALVPGGSGVRANLELGGGRSILTVNVGVPFDPGADALRARVLADRVANLVRREAPREPRPERLEVRLSHQPAGGGGPSERSFGYDLGPPAPAPGRRS